MFQMRRNLEQSRQHRHSFCNTGLAVGVRGPTEASERGGILSRFGKDQFFLSKLKKQNVIKQIYFLLFIFFPMGQKTSSNSNNY